MVTDAGTVTVVWSLLRVTLNPVAGAGPLRVRVPVDELPPVTEVGLSEKLFSRTGVMDKETEIEVGETLAVILAVAAAVTDLVPTVNVADFEPLVTVTLLGTVAAVELDASVTLRPAEGAGPARVTVPVEVAPPTTVVEERLNVESAGGLTVRLADAFVPESEAVIAETVLAATGLVAMENVEDVLPLAMVTVEGTVAAAFEEARLTTAPLAPAFALMVTVPVAVDPPYTEAGDTDTPVTFCAQQKTLRLMKTKATASL
jgi:hypothetical protein